MAIKRMDIKAISYFMSLTGMVYLVSILYRFLPGEPSLLRRLFAVILLFLVCLFISLALYNPFRKNSSNSAPYIKSLIRIFSILSVEYAFSLIIMYSYGLEKFYFKARPAFVGEWNINILPFAVCFWVVNGLIVAYFYHSVTYGLFSHRGKLAGIVASIMIFSVNYNVPFISGYWNVWDILFYGLAFAYSYSLDKNVLALFTAYIVSEMPLWWCILAPSGLRGFVLYIIFRFAVSATAVAYFAVILLKGKALA